MAKRIGDGQTGRKTPVERVQSTARDARRVDASGAPMSDSVREMLAQALAAASRSGYTRDLVADRLGISPRTLKAWVEIDGPSRIHADTLARLVRDRKILGDAAAEFLGLAFVREMGLDVVAILADRDERPAAEQFMDIAKWSGELACRIAEAGREIDADERRSIREAAREMQKELTQLIDAMGGR